MTGFDFLFSMKTQLLLLLATACLPESMQRVGATHWKTSSIFVPENFHNDYLAAVAIVQVAARFD